ncbi:MAG: serine hydrolase domain-containing protein, partial [Bacteroidota bacterium]
YLKLHQEGKLDLDAKINTIDPQLPVAYKDITFRHLLTHTSGIRHYKGKKDWVSFSDMRCASPREALSHFINDPLEAQAGEKEIYTTYGMVLASHLLEKLTDKSYVDALNDLLPFTADLLLDGEGKEKATPYIKKKKKFNEYTDLSAECKFGGGGLIGSSDDLVEAGKILYSESVINLEELKSLFRSDWEEGKTGGVSFAIGAGIAQKSFGPEPVLYSAVGGASPGGRSYLLVLADLKIAVAITTNCEGDGQDAFDLAIAVAKKIGRIEE